MKKKEEAKYLDKEWKEMDFHLKGFLETADQEELHQFRVQIKKLNAMLTLFERTSRQHGLLEEFKPVKKIFKHAGRIRDAHTNLQLGSRYDLKNEVFEAHQQKIIEEGTNEFRQQSKKYIKKINAAHRQIKKQLHTIDNSAISEFYKRQLEQIAGNLEIPKFDEGMHGNRKLIKILVYNYKFAHKTLDDSIVFNAKYLDELQSRLGDWHDNIVAAELFSSPEVNDKPVVALINKKNTGVKRAIRSLVKDFLQKATATEKPAG